MTIKRIQDSGDGIIAMRVASLQEVCEADGSWWLYYTMGADLAPKIDFYTNKGWALGDPQITGLYFTGRMTTEGKPEAGLPSGLPWDDGLGVPIHKRPIVKPNKAPNPEQALADADGENEFPRYAPDIPVSYVRESDGADWLVYQRGEHLMKVLDDLWGMGKAIHNIEVMCRSPEGDLLLHKGAQVFRRMVVPKDHPQAINPADIPRPKLIA